MATIGVRQELPWFYIGGKVISPSSSELTVSDPDIAVPEAANLITKSFLPDFEGTTTMELGLSCIDV